MNEAKSSYIITPTTEINKSVLSGWWKKPNIEESSQKVVLITDKVYSRFSDVFFFYPSHLKAVRELSNLTRWEFCVANVERNSSFNPNSLVSWELGRRNPREEIHRIYAEIASKLWCILEIKK